MENAAGSALAYARLSSDPGTAGLTSAQAAQRLSEAGPNELPGVKRYSILREIAALFLNPLSAILLLAAVIAGFLGQKVDAAIIVVIVVLGNLINFVQTYRSHNAAEKLREQVQPSASVFRDGKLVELPRRQVVPGDLIRLSAGDLVPADARLTESKDLHVQQAALTGESLPVEKEASTAAEVSEDPNSPHMVFLGTSVVSGAAQAVVIATGAQTVFGSIAGRLGSRPEETDFERGVRRFGNLITQTILFLVLLLLAVSIAMHRDPLESLLFAVALAVGLTPEFLPMITSVTLAKGAVQMSQRHVIVKHLASIQNLGSIDILCSDKTGTITSGQMTVDRYLDVDGAQSSNALTLAWINAHYETGIKSPLDAAILLLPCPVGTQYSKLDEIPFDFERRRVSIVLQHNGSRLLVVKGSPEGIAALCATREAAGSIQPFDDAAKQKFRELFESLSRDGFRVLAVAYRSVDAKAAYAGGDETDLCLAGVVTFTDPPLPDAADLVTALRRDGVELKIITGDNEMVTRHICERVGLNADSIVLGAAIESMTDPALGHVAEKANIFARVSPAQKNRIILALKHRGHAVGYMGDGINDAPSLHAADVGISVASAVDVARDAADIILVQPGLQVLHAGILEGRKAFGNVTKYLLMGTSSNFGNMFSMAWASLLLPFLPMLPAQILLNNFLYDLSQITIPTDNVDPSYLRSPQRWDISFIRKFMWIIGPISSLYDFVTFYVLLHFFRASQELFHTGWFVESLATQTLVLFIIRTAGNPFRSRPSVALTVTICLIVCAGLAVPYSPIASSLGFVRLPLTYFGFLILATGTYLVLVETAKQALFRSRG